MPLDRVDPGRDVPNDVDVVIEIPSSSDAVKYEVDIETGLARFDAAPGKPRF